ncbi:hypothetical protein IV102_19840 [bacterium]|nr:hypothetical protein [bacterium]
MSIYAKATAGCLALIMLGIALAGSHFRQVAGASVVIGFVAPQGIPSHTSHERRQLLQSWLIPTDWAVGKLLGAELTESLCNSVERRLTGDARARNRACTLVDDGGIEVKGLSATLLEIEVREGDPTLARAFCLGALEHLQQCSQSELQKLDLDTGMANQVQAGLDQVDECEDRMAKGPVQSNPVAVNYALSHYAEAITEWRTSRQRQNDWQSLVQANAPRPVLLSGPILCYGWAWKRWLGVVGVVVISAVLFASWRLARPSP